MKRIIRQQIKNSTDLCGGICEFSNNRLLQMKVISDKIKIFVQCKDRCFVSVCSYRNRYESLLFHFCGIIELDSIPTHLCGGLA